MKKFLGIVVIGICAILLSSFFLDGQTVHNTKSKYYVDDQDSATGNSINIWINVKDKRFGAVGDSATDDYAAIQKAITEASLSGKGIYFPAGKYRVSTSFSTILSQNALFVRGASRFTTIIKFTGSGNLFTMGAFHSSPANSYVGEAQDYKFTDIRLEGLDRHAEDDGLRTKIGVQDNGSGGGIFDRVAFSGFKYGFQGTYGSDFTHFTECYFEFCDTALYLGPNSNQSLITRTNIGNCVVGVINEGTYHGSIDGSFFEDNSYCDIMFRAASTLLSGVTTSATYELDYEVKNCWFEGNANGTNRIPPRHIWLTGDPAQGIPRYVRITNPLLVSGGDSSATDAFVEMQTGTRLYLDNLLVYGSHANYAVKIDTPGYFPQVYQSNTRHVDGYRAIKNYNVNQTGLYYLDPLNPTVETITSINQSGTLPIYSPVTVEFSGPMTLFDSTIVLDGTTGKITTTTGEPLKLYDAGRTNWRARLGWSESQQKVYLENRLAKGSSVRASTSGVELLGSGDAATDTIAIFKNNAGTTQSLMSGTGILGLNGIKSNFTSTTVDSFKVSTDSLLFFVGGNAYIAKRRGF